MSPTFLTLAGALGWVGAAGTIVAYALVSVRVLTATSKTFQGVNALSAALLTISATAHDSWPSAASNIVWVVIALAALARSRRLATAPEAAPLAPEPDPEPADRRELVPAA